MKKSLKRALAIIMALSLLVTGGMLSAFAAANPSNIKPITAEDFEEDGLYGYLTTNDYDTDEVSNSIVIPGLFQSNTKLYNDDGTIALNEDGEEYEAPFFLDSTTDIVLLAVKKALIPLLFTIITRCDPCDILANNVADALAEILGAKIKSDSNGKLVMNVKADKYNSPVSELTQEEKDYIYDQIPLNDYADLVGEDHLYFFSYCSFGNLEETVDELYDFIKTAAANSPTGKVNIVPISQGGSLAANLFERHKDVGQYLDRVVFIIPALDGTVLMGDLFAKGFIDDDKSLYDEIFPVLIDDTPWVGYLVNIALHLLPKKTVNAVLDKGVDALVGCLKNSTCIWGLVDSNSYPTAAEKYLSGSEDKVIRAQTDTHYKAQLNRYDNIKYQMETYGVKVFDIVDYNYSLYPIIDFWKTANADGIINVDSTSMGATSFGVDTQLPDTYTPAAGGKYVDKYNIIDAGTGLLPDQTFYFHNQNHESTGRNDAIMKLAISLLIDNNFTSVNSYPDKYPQFNEWRDAKGFAGSLTELSNKLETGDIGKADRAELTALLKEGLKVANNTTMDPDELQEYKSDFYLRRDSMINGTEYAPAEETFKEKFEDGVSDAATLLLKIVSKIMYCALIK